MNTRVVMFVLFICSTMPLPAQANEERPGDIREEIEELETAMQQSDERCTEAQRGPHEDQVCERTQAQNRWRRKKIRRLEQESRK